MKKLLALVLALVMSLSLVTISNAAFETYDDADKISYVEAAEVFKALGVLEGTDNVFNPTEKLTREQAAKIVAYLALGKEVADALPETQVFDDVAANRWSSKYVAWCAQEGIISGVGNNKFNPTGELTGYQFAKMLLCALGYDATVEGYTGNGWEIKVAKQMAELDPKLNKDVSVNPNNVLTREQATQYMWNAIQNKTVSYKENGSSITVGDIVFNTNKGDRTDGAVYMEKNFEDLKSSTTHDDFGRPATKWTYDKTTIGTYGESADYVLTLTKDYRSKWNTDAAIIKDLQDLTDNDSLTYGSRTVDGKTEYTELYVNGAAKKTAELSTAVSGTKGLVVELFCDDDFIETVVVIEYKLAKVDDISTKITKADKEDGVAAYVKLADLDGDAISGLTKICDTDFVGFDYEEDDVILYVASTKENNCVIASQLAESVEGKVTAKKGDKYAIDGTYYELAGATVNINDEGTFYLNVAGQIMAKEAKTTESGDYAYIYAVDADQTRGADGTYAKTAKVYYVDQNGVKASAVVADAEFAAVGSGEGKVTASTTAGYASDTAFVAYYDSKCTDMIKVGVVAYELNSDGEFEKVDDQADIKTVKTTAAVKKGAAAISDGTNTYYADSNTKFVFSYTKDNAQKVKTVEGYKDVNVAIGTTVYVIVNDDNDVLYVFVGADNGTLSSDAQVAVLLDADYDTTVTDKKAYTTYTVAVDGEETTLTVKSSNSTAKTLDEFLAEGDSIGLGDVFTFTLADGYVDTVALVKSTGTVGVVNSEDVYIDSTLYDVTTATVYTITYEYEDAALEKDGTFNAANNTANLDTVTVTEGKLAKDDKVVYTLDSSSDLDVVFVIEYVY